MPHELPLPKSNIYEDLETISMCRLELLFDPQRFELRREQQRDKGIDFTVELKSEGCYTNYRFAIQLKSTASPARNQDGSISHQIDVSNIGYLRNFPMIAYYVLYDHQQDAFYFEQIWGVYSSLLNKYQGKLLPSSFNVRFEKKLTTEAISEIFESNLRNGNILRQLQPHLRQAASPSGKVMDLMIDSDDNVYSREDIIAYLNQFGYYLINMGEFDYIIELEQRCHPIKNASPRFYLICGIAYYQRGKHMFEALGLMTKAEKGIAEFEPEMAGYLKFIIIDTKRRAGLIQQEDYQKELDLLFQNENIGPFFEIEKAWRKLHNEGENFSTNLPVFYKELESIIFSYPSDHRTRAFAYSRIHDVETGLAIHDLTVDIHNSVYLGAKGRIADIRRKWAILESKFHQRMDKLLEFTYLIMDLQLTPNLVLSRIRVDYSSAFIFAFYENWDPTTESTEILISPLDRKRLEKHCAFLLHSAQEMEKFGRSEIFMPSLLLRYQILHLLEEEKELAETEKTIRTGLEKYELEVFEKEFEDLLNNRMDHQLTFQASIDRILQAYETSKSINSEKTMYNSRQKYNPCNDLEFKWAIDEPYKFHFPELKMLVVNTLNEKS